MTKRIIDLNLQMNKRFSRGSVSDCQTGDEMNKYLINDDKMLFFETLHGVIRKL